MTRDDLEACIWHITGRELTGRQIDAITDACEAYAAELARKAPPPLEPELRVMRHAHETDLYPVITVLAEALMPGLPQIAARRGLGRVSAA